MRIGLCYDLRDEYRAAGFTEEETAELDDEDTILALEEALWGLGHPTDRIGHARGLVERLGRGDRWDLVFNICEGIRGLARESQVPSILDAYEIPYTFSDPFVLTLCHHKGLAKQVVRDAGLPTPAFVVAGGMDDLAKIRFDFPMFAKPVAEGTGKGISARSRVLDRESLQDTVQGLLDQFDQPVLIEEYLCGSEYTVGLVGTGPDAVVVGTMEIVLRPSAEPGAYSLWNKKHWEEHVSYRFFRPGERAEARRAEDVALAAWRVLGCRDGGRVDLRCDDRGSPYFLEVNPLAGLNPSYSDLPMLARAVGMSYSELIGRIVSSSTQRTSGREAGSGPGDRTRSSAARS